MKNSKYIKTIVLVGLLFTFGNIQQLWSQPGFVTIVDDENNEKTAPIDSFVGIALAVGVYFGAKKLKRDGQI